MTIREAITHLQGTLCPYKVRCNSEVTEKDNEAFDTLWNSIEKAERYRWHDLRKNPEDLPEEDMTVNAIITGELQGKEFIKSPICVSLFDTNDYEHKWLLTESDNFIKDSFEVIAWREIEPFESEERDES